MDIQMETAGPSRTLIQIVHYGPGNWLTSFNSDASFHFGLNTKPVIKRHVEERDTGSMFLVTSHFCLSGNYLYYCAARYLGSSTLQKYYNHRKTMQIKMANRRNKCD